MLPALLCAALFAATLGGCASHHAKSFIGQDVREVALADGPPANAFDYGADRVFQFYWGGGTVALPSHTTGHVSPTGFFSATSIGGQTISSDGCLINYFTRWDEAKDGWIVYNVSWPGRTIC